MLINEIAHRIMSRRNCLELNSKRAELHEDALCELESKLPSGGGFDAGTKIDRNRSTQDKIVFTTSFHHMNENGFYDGWTEHTVTVTPSFIGHFDVKVSGRNRNQIKDYIAETFYHVLCV